MNTNITLIYISIYNLLAIFTWSRHKKMLTRYLFIHTASVNENPSTKKESLDDDNDEEQCGFKRMLHDLWLQLTSMECHTSTKRTDETDEKQMKIYL